MPDNEKKEYSVEEVAELLKVHTNTVRGFATKGILPGTMKSEPAEDDVLGWNAEWVFTQEDLDELQKNLAKHAREKILCETGRSDEVYGRKYSDRVEELYREMKEEKGW